MDNSSFAPLPRNNELFKEFIDVFHIKAGITRLWIRSVAHKTYGLSISALTHSIHSHELLTATPKKLNEKNPVPGKPPPLRDKKKLKVHTSFPCLCPTLRTRLFGELKY
ncbi:hypothetical protein Bca4012_076004 [Brassica carinata]